MAYGNIASGTQDLRAMLSRTQSPAHQRRVSDFRLAYQAHGRGVGERAKAGQINLGGHTGADDYRAMKNVARRAAMAMLAEQMNQLTRGRRVSRFASPQSVRPGSAENRYNRAAGALYALEGTMQGRGTRVPRY
jgi:hypothetical protein